MRAWFEEGEVIKEQRLGMGLEEALGQDGLWAVEHHTALPSPLLLQEQPEHFTCPLPTAHLPRAAIPNYSRMHMRTQKIPFPLPHFQFPLWCWL